MSSAFFDHVRGRSDEVPAGYTAQGLRVYRHLVYLGVSQMIEAHFPAVREQLGDDAWTERMKRRRGVADGQAPA